MNYSPMSRSTIGDLQCFGMYEKRGFWNLFTQIVQRIATDTKLTAELSILGFFFQILILFHKQLLF